MRGKLLSNTVRNGSRRITPACAGKTYLQAYVEYKRKDHPRVCGENGVREEGEYDFKGSPPRVRGKPGAIPWDCAVHRITPACAGKTLRV